jgi:hypothetical protein
VKDIIDNQVVLSRAPEALLQHISDRLQGHRVSSDIPWARFSDRLPTFLNSP